MILILIFIVLILILFISTGHKHYTVVFITNILYVESAEINVEQILYLMLVCHSSGMLTRCRLVVSLPLTLTMGPKGCAKLLVTNFQSALHNIPEHWRSVFDATASCILGDACVVLSSVIMHLYMFPVYFVSLLIAW